MQTPFGEYDPRPLDVSDISEIIPPILQELIAEACHDAWAAEKIEQGWKYGPEFGVLSVLNKTSPLLVPYEHLSDEQKRSSPVFAEFTLKLITKLGWRVLPPES